ncbi:hypothetical protein MRY87_07000, partial [bacterium]|nr:hypothetical protein [bacterium]
VKMPLTFRQQVLEYPETILSFLFSQWAVPLLDELELSPGSPSIRSQELDAAFERAFGMDPILFPTDREECFVENVERISDVYLDLVHRWEWCSSVLRRDDLSRFLALFHSNVREKTWDADQLAQIFFSE